MATNFLLYSEDLTDPAWNVHGTLTVDDAVAPNGSTTADKSEQLTDGLDFAQQNITMSITAGETYTYSHYMKLTGSGEGTGVVQLILKRGSGPNFEQSTKNVTVLSGWNRFDVSHTFANSHANIAVRAIAVAGGANEIHLWGSQLELGSVPTAYIPTEGTAVTRVGGNELFKRRRRGGKE